MKLDNWDNTTPQLRIRLNVGSGVGSEVGKGVGSALGSEVGSGVGSLVGSDVGSDLCVCELAFFYAFLQKLKRGGNRERGWIGLGDE